MLERRAFVYDLESLHLLGTLDTPANPRGLAALTACCTPADLLALPAGGGALRVYDVGPGGGGGVDVLCELEAHKSPVVSSCSLLPALSRSSLRPLACPAAVLARATPRLGGVLRVHSQAAMAWDQEGTLLATASKKGTVVRVHAVRPTALIVRRGGQRKLPSMRAHATRAKALMRPAPCCAGSPQRGKGAGV